MREINWRKGPAQGEDHEVYCGDHFLVAVVVCDRERNRAWWELAVITITEDGAEVDGNPWGWDWSDVEFFCPSKELAASLPFTAEEMMAATTPRE